MNLLLDYPLTDELLEQIAAVAPEWTIGRAGTTDLAERLPESDVYCGHVRQPVDWPQVVRRGRLQWIQSSAAGIDHCLVPTVADSSIEVTSCSGLFRDSVAEQAMALLYGLVRSLPAFFRARLRRDFSRGPTGDLHGLTVGLVGFGGNGQRIAELLKPVAGQIVATDLLAAEWSGQPGIPPIDALWPASSLDRLLRECQVVIATAPLNEGTRNMFDRRAFALMPRGSWFVNVARGGLVDETALVEALDTGILAGAGLDVAAIEPPPAESPLWDHPQVLLTPHVGAQSQRRWSLVTELLCENIRRFRSGRSLLNRVDKALGVPHPADRAPRIS